MQWLLAAALFVFCVAQQNTSTIPQIISTSYDFLESHLCEGRKWERNYHFYRPSLEKYSPDQWLWDSGSHMIVWSWRNVTNSILDLRTMLQFQQPDGFIPEMIFWGNRTAEEEAQIRLQYSNIQYTDITQMPVLPYSLRAIWNATHNVSLLQEFVPPLVAYFDWWLNVRGIDGDNLVYIIHSWESGLDASPVYDAPYNVTNPQPNYYEMHPKFEELIDYYNFVLKWNMTAILSRTERPDTKMTNWFFVKDVGVNAIYAAGWSVLADLAANYDSDLSSYCRKQSETVSNAILNKMWNGNLRRFVSLYKDWDGSEQESRTEVVQSLLPLLLSPSILPKSIADSIINTQLLNEKKFWLPYPVPSVSADSPAFNPVLYTDLMWRGPTWAFPNWFIVEGLLTHNRYDVAEQLVNRWISLVEIAGIWEDYNPYNASAYGVEGLGMSTLIVDVIYRFNYSTPEIQ